MEKRNIFFFFSEELTCLTAWSGHDNLHAPFFPTNLLVSLTASQTAKPATSDARPSSLAIEEAHHDLAARAAWTGVGGSRRRQLGDEKRRV
jgi:hypothetical protein